MNRRQTIKGALAATLTALVPFTARPQIRRTELYIPSHDDYVAVRLSDIRKGNIFRQFEPDGTRVKSLNGDDVFVARHDAYRDGEGNWTVIIAS